MTALVVEDAPTGIRSGKASGARVLATCTSHDREDLEKERPDFLVEDLSHVKVVGWDAETNTFKLIIEQPVDRGHHNTKATPDVTPAITPAGSRMNSFSGDLRSGLMKSLNKDNYTGKPSDELTGNDSVVGSPMPSAPNSRPGSPGPQDREGASDLSRRPSVQGVTTLESFKKALAGNAQKKRTPVQEED